MVPGTWTIPQGKIRPEQSACHNSRATAMISAPVLLIIGMLGAMTPFAVWLFKAAKADLNKRGGPRDD